MVHAASVRTISMGARRKLDIAISQASGRRGCRALTGLPLVALDLGAQLGSRAALMELAVGHEAEEQRNEKDRKERRRQHPAHDASAHRVPCAGTSSGRNRER